MKKIITLICLILLTACGSSTTDNGAQLETISVIATLEPHSTILEFVEAQLNEKGYTLDIQVVDDYYIPNLAVNDGEADANFFQHIPFFEGEVNDKGYDLVNVGGVHIEPFGFYSKRISDISQLEEEATIVISNSVADNGRILNILQQYGLISIKEGVEVVDATLNDIAENPLNLQFVEVKPELLTLAYENDEGDLIAINGNYAISAGLNPTSDAVILEKADSDNPYVNILVCRSEDQDSVKIKALIECLQSEETKAFILEHYADGSVIPSE